MGPNTLLSIPPFTVSEDTQATAASIESPTWVICLTRRTNNLPSSQGFKHTTRSPGNTVSAEGRGIFRAKIYLSMSLKQELLECLHNHDREKGKREDYSV